MTKTTRKEKSTTNEGFSHPLIKHLQEPLVEDHQRIIPSYESIQPSNDHRISSKIIRSTYLPNSNLKEFLIQLSPFNQTTSALPLIPSLTSCSNCGSKMTPYSQIENHTSMMCYFCGKASDVCASAVEGSQYFGTKASKGGSGEVRPKRLAFIFEASQYIYQANMQKSLFNCLQALKGENIQVGFILFDKDYLMWVNPLTLEVTKTKVEPDCPLLETESSSQDLFISINEDLSAVSELVDCILYEGYYIKESILQETVETINQVLPSNICKTYFISNLGKTSSSPSAGLELTAVQNTVKKYQQSLKDLVSKIVQQNKSGSGPSAKLAICPNSQFYIVPYNVTYQEAIESCGFALKKMYSVKDLKAIENNLYYDLYNNLSCEQHMETSIKVRCRQDLEMVVNKHYINRVYGNVEIKPEKSSDKVNRYTITIKKADPSFSLILHFKTNQNNHNTTSKALVQLQYTHINQGQLVLNATPFRGESMLESYDDELIFKYHLEQCISEWNGQSYKQLRLSLVEKYTEVVWMLRHYCQSDGISFPKSWKHYMLHSFVVDTLIATGRLNSYTIYEMLTSDLAHLAKQLYYRFYKIAEGEVVSIKNGGTVFQKHSCTFVDNGSTIFMVMADPSVQELKDIFGHFDTVPSLANTYPQLPVLPSNQQYRQAIETIRSTSEHRFLPLQIIDVESYLFTELIQPHLYTKEEHKTFLRKLWRSA